MKSTTSISMDPAELHEAEYYFPASLHPAPNIHNCRYDVFCDGCGPPFPLPQVGTEARREAQQHTLTACIGWTRNGTERDLCIKCFIKYIDGLDEDGISLIRANRLNRLNRLNHLNRLNYLSYSQAPTCIHIINCGQLQICNDPSDLAVCCVRCKTAGHKASLVSSKGHLCFPCVDKLTQILQPMWLAN